MSYAHDNHYEWVESAYKIKCSELGKQVANILGYVGRGIYNAPFKTEKVDWSNNHCVEVNWEQSMVNWDGCHLTNLVIECHRRMIRVSIQPNMRTMKIMFWQRNSRTGGMSERLPDIEEMIKSQDEQWGRETTNAIRAEARAEALKDAADRAVAWYNSDIDLYHAHENDDDWWNTQLRAAITQEPLDVL